MPRVRIAITDDHALVREGLARLLGKYREFEIVGTAGDAPGTLDLLRKTKPDLLLLDLSLPSTNGLTALPELCKASPQTKILMLSMYDEPEYVQAAISRGACGLVSKAASPDALYSAIKAAMSGNPPSLRSDERLTAREREILELLKAGKEDEEIASALKISAKTVANHCERLMGKLGVHTRAGLIAHAKRTELAPPD